MLMNNLPAIRTGGGARSIVPQTYEEVQRIAQIGVAAGLFKPVGNDRNAAMAQCALVIMHGLDLGLTPTQAMQGIAIINGKTSIYGALLIAVLMQNGCKVRKWVEEKDGKLIGWASITRPDGGVITSSFSQDDAIRAKLWESGNNWQKFPQRMLSWRALGNAAKDGAPDFLYGTLLKEAEEGDDYSETMKQTSPSQNKYLPEIPEVEHSQVQLTVVEQTAQEINDETDESIVDPLIADETGLRDLIFEQISCANSRDDIDEIRSSNHDLIMRCSQTIQAQIEDAFDAAIMEII